MSVVARRMAGDVAVLSIDNPPVNAGTREVRMGLLAELRALQDVPGLRGVVITGAGTNFYSGSDIKEFDGPLAEPQLPSVIEAVEQLPVPVVAAIRGLALGGGFELALGCDVRLADSTAVVGLPEVGLGIIPGAGGTVRLPRLTGAPVAVDMIVSAARIDAETARARGILDEIVDGDVVERAVVVAGGATKRVLADEPAPGDLDTDEYTATVARVTRRNAERPAVRAALDAVRAACLQPGRAALISERLVFTDLRESAEAGNLRYLFFAERAAAKAFKIGADPLPVRDVAVVGAGTMGASIAAALISAGYGVTLIDTSAAALQRARGTIASNTRSESLAEQVVLSADLHAAGSAQLIIDAVFEDLEVKKTLLRTLDEIADPAAVLASNTSYLDLDEIGAVVADPTRVAGLHFFNPAHRNRLLEIVETAKTSPATLATLAKVAGRLRKVAIRAQVGEGFIANRIYSAYRAQCEFLLEDGATPEQIDRALTGFGFAMGPFAVADMSGLDIAWARRKRLTATRDPQQRYVGIPDKLCEAGRFGRKTDAGYYDYAGGKAAPDPAVLDIIAAERERKGLVAKTFSDDDIVRSAITAMVAEAANVLADGIAGRASDIDLAMVTGFAFPRHHGGPLRYAAAQSQEWLLDGLRTNHAACAVTFAHAVDASGVPDSVREVLAAVAG